MGPQPSSRGNPGLSDLTRSGLTASMGPQPSSRGNSAPPEVGDGDVGFNGAATFQSRKSDPRRAPPAQSRRFNGAATFQSRKSNARHEVSARCPRFNGAATFQSRKSRYRRLGGISVKGLQWGRNLPVAEIRSGRPNSGRERAGFNGAATFQSRKFHR